MLHCAQAGQREGDRVQREGGGHQEGHRESNALTGPRMTCQFHVLSVIPPIRLRMTSQCQPPHLIPDDMSCDSCQPLIRFRMTCQCQPPHSTPDDVLVSSPSFNSG
jgi:hypothetical protein